MSNNLDDFLNSLGIEAPSTNVEGPAIVSTTDTVTPSESISEQITQNLSNDDFDDILGEFGFSRTEDAQAEEITEEGDREEEVVENTDSSEEYNENIGEGRDLDAEEDADWQERIDSGEITPQEVHFHMPNGEVIDAPIIQEETPTEAQAAPPVQEPLIPLNSPTLFLDESTTRFSGAEWYNEIQRKSIIFAGCGGIGSWAILQLSRMKPASLVLYDDDMVEMVNMAGQLYARGDIGKSKVTAITDMITSYTNMQNIFGIQERFTEHTEAGDIMMCGFDNMHARRVFFGSWYDHVMSKSVEERKNCLLLDGRLSMTDLQVFCLTGDDTVNIDRYSKEFLFSDAEADETVCSMKQTTYLACMIGSVMVNLFTNWVANSLEPIIPYDLPFFTEYDAQNMIFKTIK